MSLQLDTVVPLRPAARASAGVDSDSVAAECRPIFQPSVYVGRLFAASATSYAKPTEEATGVKHGLFGARAGRSKRIFSAVLTPMVRGVMQHMGLARECVGSLVNPLANALDGAELGAVVG